jgi:hypothetical protein
MNIFGFYLIELPFQILILREAVIELEEIGRGGSGRVSRGKLHLLNCTLS